MSFNLIASAAASVARFASPTDPIAQQSPASIGPSMDAVALNPQPLPLRELGASLLGRLNAVAPTLGTVSLRVVNQVHLAHLAEANLTHLGGSLLGRLNAVALNPQPLPPHELGIGSLLRRLDAVALNPQPLPPRELGGSLLGRLNAVALNPQPLPPHELGIGSLLRRLDAVALNPQPLPPRATLQIR